MQYPYLSRAYCFMLTAYFAITLGVQCGQQLKVYCTTHHNVVKVCTFKNLIILRGEVYFLKNEQNYNDQEQTEGFFNIKDIVKSRQINVLDEQQFLSFQAQYQQNMQEIEYGIGLYQFRGQEGFKQVSGAVQNSFIGVLVHWMLEQISRTEQNFNLAETQLFFLDDLKNYQGEYYKSLEVEQSWVCFLQEWLLYLDVTRFQEQLFFIKRGVILDYDFKFQHNQYDQKDTLTPKQFIQKIWSKIENSWYERIKKCASKQQAHITTETPIQHEENSQFLSNENNSVFIGITSYAMTLQRREMIRATWLQFIKFYKNINYKFVISNSDKQFISSTEIFENNQDIIFVETPNNYDNLWFKVFELFKYFSSDQNNYNYLFKTDDDTYVHIPRLISQLSSDLNNQINIKQQQISQFLYFGFELNPQTLKQLQEFGFSVRQINGHQVHIEQHYLYNKQVIYMQGGGYVINREIVQQILKNQDNQLSLPIFSAEDFTLKWWLDEMNVSVQNVKWNDFMFVNRRSFDHCKNNQYCDFCKKYGYQLFLLHKVYPMEMFKYHKNAVNCKQQNKYQIQL
eukprot:TRINITY_DN16534_c0_g1_i2.p2 TRINITY_DN16534_c0_g1~~TRINITY_DN16534_c0_g1_i2.p2  ORF type:complete len:614 (+),score=32.98 TRINITY_DN16534_c0_g1_i2:144-1844(+)